MDENFAAFLESGKDPYFQDQSHFTSFNYQRDGITCKDLNYVYITDKDTLDTMKLTLSEQSQRNIGSNKDEELIILRQPVTNENVLNLEQTEKVQRKQKSVQELEFINTVLKDFTQEEQKNLIYYSKPMAIIISGYFTHFKSVKRVLYIDKDSGKHEREENLMKVQCLFLSKNYITDNKIQGSDVAKCLVEFQVSKFLGVKDFFQLFQSYSINNLEIPKDQIYKKLYLIDWKNQQQNDKIDLTQILNGYELSNENFSSLKSEGQIFLFLTQNSFQLVDRFINLKDIQEIKEERTEEENTNQQSQNQNEDNDLSRSQSSVEEFSQNQFTIQCCHCKKQIEDATKCPFCVCGKIYCTKYCRTKNNKHECNHKRCSYCDKYLVKDELYSMKINRCGDMYCEEDCQDQDREKHLVNCEICANPNQKSSSKNYKTNYKKQLYELGVVGLRNIGNTCYMNSALQCVFHTRILQTILFKTNLSSMINQNNPLGSGGVLIKNFQEVFEAYWSQQHSVLSLGEFKQIVGKFMPTFQGYDQHDSQEFYSQLLDNFHEDINVIKKKPFVENLEGKIGDNEVKLARQSWINFLKRNLSVFVNYFYGQYRSLVECNKCDNKSLIFDPFSVLVLDIPKKVKKTFNIYHIPKDHLGQITRYNFKSTSCNMFKEIYIGEIKKHFSEFLKLDKDDFVICFLGREKEGQMLKSRDSLFNFYERTQLFRIRPELFIYELDEEEKVLRKQKSTILKFLKFSHEEFDVPEKQKDTIQYFRMTRQSGLHEDYAFNKPLYINQDITNKQLYIQAFRKLFPALEDFVQKYENTNKNYKFYSQLWNELVEQNQFLFYLKYKDNKIEYNDEKFSSKFDIKDDNNLIYLFVVNKDNLKQQINMDNFLSCNSGDQDDYPNFVKEDQNSFKRELSIYDLLTKFQMKEQLDDMNAWYCRECKEHVLAYKTLNIYKAPEYLVIMLKKLKSYKDDFPSVTYPIDVLDISPYMENKESVLHYNVDLKEILSEEEYEKHGSNVNVLNPPPKVSTKYKLYGVVNHYGSQMFGHYTACCYLESKSKWINFDDSSATEIPKESVVSDNAYLLFYRKIDDLESLD